MNMIRLKPWLFSVGITGVLCVVGCSVWAQGGGMGGFDPAQMQQQIRQMQMNNYRTQLEVKTDEDWTAIQPLIQKIIDSRGSDNGIVNTGGLASLLSGLGQLNQGGGAGRGGGRGLGNIGTLLGPGDAEEQALQDAINANASPASVKSLLDKFNAARKAKQAKTEAAQAELRKKLSVRQEAIASLIGLL
jgi:hypothetical protein